MLMILHLLRRHSFPGQLFDGAKDEELQRQRQHIEVQPHALEDQLGVHRKSITLHDGHLVPE
jgi:hypothetical protein